MSSASPAGSGSDKDGVPMEEGLARYLAYAARVGRLFSKVSRYSAYASDVGEAFRPVVPVSVVNASYAVAFGYVGCDIIYNGYRAQQENRSVQRAVAHATVFQGLASLLAPYMIIHTTVSAATKACKQMGKFQRYGPTVSGLALIPLLPSLVDEPIEEGVHWAFETYWPEGGSSSSSHGSKTAHAPTPAVSTTEAELEKKHA